jgi:hypothetical protein
LTVSYTTGRGGRRVLSGALCALAAAFLAAGSASAATPASATLSPDANGNGKTTWTGTIIGGTAAGGVSDDCFDADGKPDPNSGCDFYNLTVNVPSGFYAGFLGGVEVRLTGFAPFDLDLGIYRLNQDGSHGPEVTGSGNAPGEDERTTISAASGKYILAIVPFAAAPGTSYDGVAEFKVKKPVFTLAQLNQRTPGGEPNYRASRDKYNSHSEPTIVMDPLNHDHLVAGSKQYENLGEYLFKIGTYESFDGGKTWTDYGHLPGYCEAPGQCDPKNLTDYRVTSDISMAFDDEGNAYGNVLDAPGGAGSGGGWNMAVHIKRPGKPWTGPIVAHSNRDNAIQNNFILDDKNWITVDNHTDVNGGPNRPGDGKIGTIYVCWSFDGPTAVSQQVSLVRSTDGGKTWGGVAPGDNTPLPLSQKSVVSGIGCHIAIGPKGEVYATWYDNQLDALMQAKSTDRGHSFTPARPVAMITGVNSPFEGQSFRNLSIPTTGVDSKGNVYLAATSANAEGAPVARDASPEDLKNIREKLDREQEADGGSGTCPDADPEASPNPSCSDIVMFKSTDGGQSYTGPVRVNQDGKNQPADQFQPWMAVTERDQVNISYFDRRNDPSNFFIDTYLSRSNDGGKTFKDIRVSRMLWDPRINPPISPSGEFIGDYQGLAADDSVAIPFWNDTQGANLKSTDKDYSPWQEVWAGRVENVPSKGGPKPRCLPRRVKLGAKSLAGIGLRNRSSTVVRRRGLPSRRRKGVWRYCVTGGGKVIVVFNKRKRALFIATTARGHRRGKVRPGVRARTARRVFGRSLRRVRSGVYRVRRGRSKYLVIGVRRGRVRYLALADRTLLRSRRLLLRYHKRAGFVRKKHKRVRRRQ